MWYFGQLKHSDEWVFCFNKSSVRSYVEVSDKIHSEIIDTLNVQQDKMLSGDKDGNPIIIDRPPPTPDEQKYARIKELHRYLESTDWYAIRFADTGEEIPSEIKKARQDARDEISKLEN